MPTRPLPADPSFEHLRKLAKRLRDAIRAGDPEALAAVREFHPHAERVRERCSLADAQLVAARAHGFPSWARLKKHLAEIEPLVWTPPPAPDSASRADVFVRLACLTYDGWQRSNASRASQLLAEHPDLAAASLWCAVAAGNVAAVERFLDADRALVRRKDGPLRWEPLLYACYSRVRAEAGRSTLDVARLLLSRGADPSAGFLLSGSYAFTALTGTFGRGEDWENQLPHPEWEKLARLLLDAGADPNDAQALYNRHFKEDDEHLQLLFDYGLGQDRGGPWLKRLTDENATPSTMLVQQLCWAAAHGFRNRLRLLAGHGVDVNARCPRSGRTAYQEAIRSDHHAAAEDLARYGAVRLELDPLETFALACVNGRRDEVQQRLAADGGLLDRLGPHGLVELLHRAADTKNAGAIRLMLDLGADINGMIPGTGFDRAVLHNAAAWGGVELVRLLVSLGADPQLRDLAYRASAIGWAAYHGQRDVVADLLPQAGILDALRCGGVARVHELLEQQPSLVSLRDDDGDPLAFSVHGGLAQPGEMVAVLAAHGADVNARNSMGKTALDQALACGWNEVAAALRAHGGKAAADLSSPG